MLKRNYIGIEKEPEYIKLANKRIANINEHFEEADWIEEEKVKQKRVSFETLVKEEFIRVGESLCAKKKYNVVAFVLSDGNLQYQNAKGSIHRIGAVIQQTPSCNGWKFWHIVRNDKSILIDELRTEYLKARSAILSLEKEFA
jgi:hypothetical protein